MFLFLNLPIPFWPLFASVVLGFQLLILGGRHSSLVPWFYSFFGGICNGFRVIFEVFFKILCPRISQYAFSLLIESAHLLVNVMQNLNFEMFKKNHIWFVQFCSKNAYEEIYTRIKGLNWPLYINKNWKPFVKKNQASKWGLHQPCECVVSCCNIQ